MLAAVTANPDAEGEEEAVSTRSAAAREIYQKGKDRVLALTKNNAASATKLPFPLETEQPLSTDSNNNSSSATSAALSTAKSRLSSRYRRSKDRIRALRQAREDEASISSSSSKKLGGVSSSANKGNKTGSPVLQNEVYQPLQEAVAAIEEALQEALDSNKNGSSADELEPRVHRVILPAATYYDTYLQRQTSSRLNSTNDEGLVATAAAAEVKSSTAPPLPPPPLLGQAVSFAKRMSLQLLSAGSPVTWGTPVTTVTPPTPTVLVPPVVAVPSSVLSEVQKVVVLGVHGWSVFGGALSDPLPVSEQFCRQATLAFAHAVADSKTATDRPVSAFEVCQLPLSGHGCVKQRVKQYLNGPLTDHEAVLRQADMIFVACHSQGCVVSTFMLWDLITSGVLDPRRQHICVLGMAGVHHGPYPDTVNDFYTATAELFEFSKAHSTLAVEYLATIQQLSASRVKMVLIGAFSDEVVPLFSATVHALAGNPNLLRGLYIDHRFNHLPEFLVSLFTLALHVNNSAQFTDLLVHLSGFFRGSVLNRKLMHSEIHRCQAIYNRAMLWALKFRGVELDHDPVPVPVLQALTETDTVPKERLLQVASVHTHSFALFSGLLTESFITSELNRHILRIRCKELVKLCEARQLTGEVQSLRMLFDQWEPRGKQAKLLHDTLTPVFGRPQSNL